MDHRATSEFWQAHRNLPSDIQLRADKQFALLRSNANHPSLNFEKIGERNGMEL